MSSCLSNQEFNKQAEMKLLTISLASHKEFKEDN